MTDRLPFLASDAARGYENIKKLPVAVLLENVRSMYNVGSFFRTADAVALEKLYLSGFTSYPPKKEITKTALGAEDRVPWQHSLQPLELAAQITAHGYELAAIETSPRAVDIFDWVPRFPVCLVFGDSFVRIPMLGSKHSLNVATAGGVALYELLRKYRNLLQNV
jgi:23S rRNA (guanosine2251-2'-O)-methyltransferase